MKRALAELSVVVAMILAWPGWSAAQDTGPQLRVVTAGGRTTFRIGERIPLELVFTGPGDGRYRVTVHGGERSPGFDLETFAVSPEGGWADPLRIYFHSMGGFGGSWASGIGYLSRKPTVAPADLNEWVRFDQPGTYQVIVTSYRVSDLSVRGPSGYPGVGLKLTSNPITLRIIPATEAWQKAKLAQIDSVLEKPVKQGSPQYSNHVTAMNAAMADLEVLGTPGAAAIMAKHLRDDDPLSYQCLMGLAGLPENVRPAALKDLNAELDDPDFPVSLSFLQTMAGLQISEGPAATMREERSQFSDQAWRSAFDVLESKRGKAQAKTADALLSWRPTPLTAEEKGELGRVLSRDLAELSPEGQANALRNQWDLIRPHIGVAMLEQLAATPLKNPESNVSSDYAIRELKSAALRRWYELDPIGAKQEILREIGTANPELTAQALAFLPKEKLPQFEYMWAQQFAATNDALYAGLLAKFGEGDAVALVESKADANIGKWACDPQDAALAYIAEFDPDNALPLIERALAARGRGQTGCYQQLFQGIDQYATPPVLTKAAIEAVSDPNIDVVEDALIYLAAYGDASAKTAILNRYAAWTAQWRGRADELETRSSSGQFPDQQTHWKEIGLGRDLLQALLENQGWIATPDLIAKVLAGCVGEQMCKEAKQSAREAEQQPYSVQLSPGPDGSAFFNVAQCQVKSLDLLDQKVEQYPRGTRFTLQLFGGFGSTEGSTLRNKLKAIFAKHGMVLVNPRGGIIG